MPPKDQEGTGMKQRVLFLCTHNSARSQMAQGLLSWLAPEHYAAYSAGTHPTQQNSLAVKAMAELGINILSQGVHALDDYVGQPFDLVQKTVRVQPRRADAARGCPATSSGHRQLATPSSFPYDRLIIATGARSHVPAISGWSRRVCISSIPWSRVSRCIGISLERAPQHAVIVGAGYIGMEMSEALSSRGLRPRCSSVARYIHPSVDPAFGAAVSR